MLGVALDEGFDQGGFADAWRTDDGDDLRGRVGGKTVDLGDMEALFFDLLGVSCAVARGEGIGYIMRASSLFG